MCIRVNGTHVSVCACTYVEIHIYIWWHRTHKLDVTSPPDLCVHTYIRIYGCECVLVYIYTNTYTYSDTLRTSSMSPLQPVFVWISSWTVEPTQPKIESKISSVDFIGTPFTLWIISPTTILPAFWKNSFQGYHPLFTAVPHTPLDATHCHTLAQRQYTTTHHYPTNCHILYTATRYYPTRHRPAWYQRRIKLTLQHTATHCNILQHTATRDNTLQQTATNRSPMQHRPGW